MRQTFDDHADPSFGGRHLPLIRQELRNDGLDGFLIPHEDEHQNEYLPDANERLAWATGFTGSAGAAVVLLDTAAVFVDGRYTLQVKTQVDPELFSTFDSADNGLARFLEETTRPGQTIGYDPRLHSPDALASLRAAVEKSGAKLSPVAANPVDRAWGESRPAQPKARISPHAESLSGEASAAKRQRLAETLQRSGADAALLTAPSSIAWLFNIRGGDVIRSPLPLGQALLRSDGAADLFLDPDKVPPELPAFLGNAVALRAPEELSSALQDLKGKTVQVDPAQSSAWYFDHLEAAGAKVARQADPCALPRACKNAVEIAGARSAHERDGAAMVRFLHWLASEAETTRPDEIEVVSRLEGFREATGALKDLSFDTIAGAGPNGAIVHYRPTRTTNRRVAPGELLLVDSGAQYLDGTTDITRTIAIGAPSPEMRERFTLVLKGHIALSSARFPEGVTGSALDALARLPLWSRGLDFDHGTGHGVGSYLGVHEGPQRIAKAPNAVALRPGMILSNEPGYYKTGAYGIRIENLLVVTEPSTPPEGEREMMAFEVLTLAPIDRSLIDAAALTSEERAWVDAYHARVGAVVGPKIDGAAAEWLQEVCRPL